MTVKRAGVIPFIQESEVKMLFMKSSDPVYGGPDFQVAKGTIDPGETEFEAACREAYEEIGFFKNNAADIRKLGTFFGSTIYVAKMKDKNMFGDPKPNDEGVLETAAVKWLTHDEFMDEGRDLHKPCVKAAHRLITERMTNDS
jgi:8-oxo-dGTP pyrophosphatase MutT (NUDIX family)